MASMIFPKCFMMAVLMMGTVAPVLAEDMVIDDVTLVDGTGHAKQEHMSIGIKDGRFTYIMPTALAPAETGRHIDGKGKYIVPGFIDVHIHLKGPRGGDGARMVGSAPKGETPNAIPNGDLAPQPVYTPAQMAAGRVLGLGALAGFLYSGVTTVYDAGNYADYIIELRAAERGGKILAPHILATGNLITYPGSHGDSMAVRIDSWPQGKPALLKYLETQKPDIVKLTLEEHGWGTRPLIPLMPNDLMQDIILEVNRHGIRTTAHTSSELRAIDAIFAGADSLAHPVVQGPISPEFAKLMGAKKTPMASTLTIGEGYSRLVEHPEFLDQPLYQAAISPAELNELKTKTLPAWRDRGWTWWMKLMTPVAQENIRQIYAAGGVVAIGTDQSSGPAVHREMELLQAAGIPAADIIMMATLNGAKHLGRAAEFGSIETGKCADAVLLNSDPTIDINNAKDIVFVMKGGKLIDEDKLPLPGGGRPLRRAAR
ncbi:amidohydrolase family protein [Sphingobium boeckii]|uniref:Imidazolonepropionase-like amidohydrolase n=1 Tax=Sphingobium boeckii TaxID=1082345 RepID=A0A7W9EE99_9SPHN|nr:amidohydrolase family protein [Sphingobium boeckii]MBB5684785.1 imidazolonepropionase-like amidohydrolase [Sphingobium boeckii]